MRYVAVIIIVMLAGCDRAESGRTQAPPATTSSTASASSGGQSGVSGDPNRDNAARASGGVVADPPARQRQP
jgi:hypothetical protein